MSDPRVDSCPHQKRTESEKIRCIFPGRPYYFCKTNRRDNVCPVGLTTTYDDPVAMLERPFISGMESARKRFHELHETNRWDLSNKMDSFQLYYQLDLLQIRYFELAFALQRAGRHKDSHFAWAKHDAYGAVLEDLFPYRDGGGRNLGKEYRKVQKELAELRGEERDQL